MISEAEALAAVLGKVRPLPVARAALLDSLGRFAAKDVVATRALPAFDNSAMDGYAIIAGSSPPGQPLRVIGEQPAGPDRGLTIRPGEAARIFTGAPLPTGADAVVMQEEVLREGETIVFREPVASGEFVRRRAADLAEGQKILGRGQPIAAATLGVLGSQGLTEIAVGSRPRVSVISTGDELARPGATLRPGQIFESNGILLHALALQSGAEVSLVAHAPDAMEPLREILQRALEFDALVISGGVSVGEHDLVKPALRELGAELDVWRVAIKPGKPFLFGNAGGCAIFGLPGNPVSAFVTFLKFVRPALRKMSGAAEEHLALRRLPARLTNALRNESERPHYFRGTLRDGIFRTAGAQESHALFGLSRSNALLRFDPGENRPAEALVEVEVWD